ncbi:glycosyltransferase [Desulfotignum balticum]|uniref:glycosyltransferase n=1 Tax=Desulfotignum balticum TaxID=115781 RepID=UPI000416C845|nr:glycosyltransferase family 2 protein [Desulfotignum balticum]
MEKKGVSLIIPTLREAQNLKKLIPILDRVLGQNGLHFEILVVDDDSADGTIEIIEELAETIPVSLYVRRDMQGLSSAVLHGFRQARFPVLVVMDADLSHAPEDVPRLIAPILKQEVDFVLGSRYIKGGKISRNWGLFRYLNTYIATWLAHPLVKVKDPMSGFFALKQELLEDADFFNPLGYKIGLELIVKTRPKRIKEIPIFFGMREACESKLTFQQQLLYLAHLKRLYEYKWYFQVQFLLFCAVGGLGTIVDFSAMFIFHGLMGMNFEIARFPSFLVAATSNFQLNRMITFSDSTRQKWIRQWLGFVTVSALGFLGNFFVSTHLFNSHLFFQRHYFIPVFAGSIAGAFVNFTLSKIAVFDSSTIYGLTPGVKPFVFEKNIRQNKRGRASDKAVIHEHTEK